MDIAVVSMLAGFAAIFLFLYVAAVISWRRDWRGAAALERWAAGNGWSFFPDTTVRKRPAAREGGVGEAFTDRFNMTPDEVLNGIPETLWQARLTREVSPWTGQDS